MIFWWVRQIFFVLLGVFFLLFGICLLISAYHLKSPFGFLMTFFSSNLIILISGTIVVGLVIRMMPSKRMLNKEKQNDIEQI